MMCLGISLKFIPTEFFAGFYPGLALIIVGVRYFISWISVSNSLKYKKLDQLAELVGVTGFEPATSTSRT